MDIIYIMFSFLLNTFKIASCVTATFIFFFQAEDGIRDLVRSRGLGDVYKRQGSGMENHSKYGKNIFFHNNDELYISQFIAAELTLSLIHI